MTTVPVRSLSGIPTAGVDPVATDTLIGVNGGSTDFQWTFVQIARTIASIIGSGVLSKSFTSTGQTITSSGALAIPHGLGTIPKLIHFRLLCVNAEDGYSPGDLVEASVGANPSGNQGISIVPDATNINVRYASNAQVFMAVNKTTGAVVNLTNSNWQAVFTAWA